MSIKKSENPFVVPEGYFESVPLEVEKRIAPFHSKLLKENPMKVPEKYFEDFEVVLPKKKKSRIIWLMSGSVAASLILCFSLFGLYNSKPLNEDAYDFWVEDNFEQLSESEMSEITSFNQIEIYDDIKLNNKDIEDYFEIENLDLSEMNF